MFDMHNHFYLQDVKQIETATHFSTKWKILENGGHGHWSLVTSVNRPWYVNFLLNWLREGFVHRWASQYSITHSGWFSHLHLFASDSSYDFDKFRNFHANLNLFLFFFQELFDRFESECQLHKHQTGALVIPKKPWLCEGFVHTSASITHVSLVLFIFFCLQVYRLQWLQ